MADDKLLSQFSTKDNQHLFENYYKSKIELYNSVFPQLQEKFQLETKGKVLYNNQCFSDVYSDVDKTKHSMEIKMLYRKLILIYHPDKNPNSDPEICAKINDLYENDDLEGLENLEKELKTGIKQFSISVKTNIENIENSWAFQYTVGHMTETIKSKFISEKEFDEKIKKNEDYYNNLEQYNKFMENHQKITKLYNEREKYQEIVSYLKNEKHKIDMQNIRLDEKISVKEIEKQILEAEIPVKEIDEKIKNLQNN